MTVAVAPASDSTLTSTLRRRPELIVGAALLVLLVATSAGYGWHRDELYFRAAGRHPAFGYPDQPPFTPLLVAAADAISGGSLVVVRLASAMASAATAVLTGMIAAEMGGGRRARVIAAATWAVGGVSLVTGHFVDTTTFDVLAATGVCWCVARAIRKADPGWIAIAGIVLGVGLLNKLLVGFAAAFLLIGLIIAGPRSVLKSRPLIVAAAAAAVGAAPYVLWQAAHGWPQLDLARSIASEGAEGGRIGVIPFQLVLVSLVLTPVWVAGIVRLLRRSTSSGHIPAARPFRAFAIAYLAYLPFLIIAGGKAYYAADLLPPLVAAGAIATDSWMARGRARLRQALVIAALVLALVDDALLGLDVLPARLLNGIVIAVNPDAGEQVGWPQFTAAVASGWRQIPPAEQTNAVIFTQNYGEAGAIDKFGPESGLPQAYSGHNAFALWGPPEQSGAEQAGPVEIVGYAADDPTMRFFRDCRQVATVDNGLGLDNDEQGDTVLLCSGTTLPWQQLWPSLRHYD